jgi:hypothetical protein
VQAAMIAALRRMRHPSSHDLLPSNLSCVAARPARRELMTRLSFCTALAALTVLAVSPNADARTSRTHAAQDGAAAITGAHNSITDENSIRQQCAETARSRWPSSNQEMQTNRDFAYRTCAFDHGVRNP